MLVNFMVLRHHVIHKVTYFSVHKNMGNTQGSRAEKSRHFSGDDQGPMMAASKHDYDLYAVDDQSEYSSAIKVC